MAPATAPKKPTSQERVELMMGPRVDIYVGAQKKHYSLPKKLLCYYSDYFKACFNSNFIQGRTQKLDLVEDPVQYFEILLEYMLSSGLVPKDAVRIEKKGKFGLKKCMDFIEYTDKYGMGDASRAVADSLERILPTPDTWDSSVGAYVTACIDPVHVETIFRVTSPGSPLRVLIARAALSNAGMGSKKFAKQERDVEGFASELLAQMRPILSSCGLTWKDPFNNIERRH